MPTFIKFGNAENHRYFCCLAKKEHPQKYATGTQNIVSNRPKLLIDKHSGRQSNDLYKLREKLTTNSVTEITLRGAMADCPPPLDTPLSVPSRLVFPESLRS